jgi:tRNA(adenine34) deaminase
MDEALKQARRALDKDEVPVGAVIVQNGRLISRGHNLVESLQDPTAHAEMLAITAAASTTASWRLDDSVLYVTLEPCPMCAGAILMSRIKTLVFGTRDPRYGACGSVLQVVQNDLLDINIEIIEGVLQEACSTLLNEFFEKLRSGRR